MIHYESLTHVNMQTPAVHQRINVLSHTLARTKETLSIQFGKETLIKERERERTEPSSTKA